MSSSKTRSLLLLLATVVASMVAAVAGLWVTRLVVPHHIMAVNNDVAGTYLQTLGSIYGVLLAFVVFVVWTQQNEAARLVEREAHGLRDIVRLARALGGPVRLPMLRALEAYAQAVIEQEWPAMQRRQACPEASHCLRELWEIIEAVEPQRPREQALYAEAIRSFNELGDARADRVHSSTTRLPYSVRIFVVAGGICTVASLYLFGLEPFWPLAMMAAVLAGAVSHIVYLICDLDSPFGDWQVTAGPIERVRDKVCEELRDALAAESAGQ